MSSRALRKLHGGRELPGAEVLEIGIDDGNDEAHIAEPAPARKQKKKKKKDADIDIPDNPFNLLPEEEPELSCDDKADSDVDNGNPPELNEAEVPNCEENDNLPASGGARKKKKKKKKKSKTLPAEEEDEKNDVEDEIEASVREVNRLLGEIPTHPTGSAAFDSDTHVTTNMKALLNVQHRNLNADHELRRMFGARVVQTDQNRRRQRNQAYHKSSWLVKAKDTWPHIGKTGLSMNLLETRQGCQYFTFEHSRQYQQIQFQFLDAVESLDPQNIMNVLHGHPHHVDTLLQVSEICKMSEDIQMATDLVERSLYVFECNFHASFSLTQGTSRLDYRRPENRAFYIALFRHLMFVGDKGCYRTALEFCKLLLSLDPEGDPLCVILMLDFYAVRAEQYDFLIRMFQEWEAHRNLSQLPNFAFSVPLARFHQSRDGDTTVADEELQNALMMFPGLLIPLLDKCSVSPDPQVAAHPYFGVSNRISQPKALEQLIALYIGRCHSCWKEQEVVGWLERNTSEVIRRVDNADPLVKEYVQRRQGRYQGTPRNIHRHIIMSEIKEASAALPPELSHMPVMSYDPLPPTNSIATYQRPERQRRAQQGSNPLSTFFQSLLPNYNPQELVGEAEGAVGGQEQGNNLRQGMVQLMDAMRQLLNNITPAPPPVENPQEPDNPQPDDEWD